MKIKNIIIIFFIFSFIVFSQTISLASFNIQHLGTAKKNISYVSQILTLFDFTAIQEVQNKHVIEQLEKKNPQLTFIVSNVSVGKSYKEFYAFAYKKNTLQADSLGFYPGNGFLRPPFAVLLTSNHQNILIINTHIQFGKSQLIREQEISNLPKVVAYFSNKYPMIKNIAIMGDFNVDSNSTISYLLSTTKEKMLPVINPNILTTIGKNNYVNQYDKIFASPTLFSEITTSGTIQVKNISLLTFKKEISDHRPIFMNVNVY